MNQSVFQTLKWLLLIHLPIICVGVLVTGAVAAFCVSCSRQNPASFGKPSAESEIRLQLQSPEDTN